MTTEPTDSASLQSWERRAMEETLQYEFIGEPESAAEAFLEYIVAGLNVLGTEIGAPDCYLGRARVEVRVGGQNLTITISP